MQGEGFLQCVVTGDVDSVLAVVWQRDGALVLSIPETTFDGALISFLSSPASGNYICQAILLSEIMSSGDLIYTGQCIYTLHTCTCIYCIYTLYIIILSIYIYCIITHIHCIYVIIL